MRLSARVSGIVVSAAATAFAAYKFRHFLPASSLSSIHSIFARGNPTTSVTSVTTASAATTATTSMATRAAVVALSHGGGPMPILGDPDSKALVSSMRERVPKILGLTQDPSSPARPKAILLVTAHWSTKNPTLSANLKHDLLYDYYGFPDAAYRLTYDAPGSPAVAERAAELLKEAGFESSLDMGRGWDHGVFVPMLLVHPQADIPIVQMSVLRNQDPAVHFAMGRALSKLRDEGVAIVGSGFASMHNLQLMFNPDFVNTSMRSQLTAWNEAVTAAAIHDSSAAARDASFRKWRSWPGATLAHPSNAADHFMPLIVCAGAADDGEQGYAYKDDYIGFGIYSYYWGGAKL